MLSELLVTQMSNSSELQHEVTQWRKLDRGDPKRSLQALLDIIDDRLAFIIETQNRNRIDRNREAAAQYAAAAPAKGESKGKGKGKGKDGKGKGKGDGKGKGKRKDQQGS
jgi:hypothetical protein